MVPKCPKRGIKMINSDQDDSATALEEFLKSLQG